MPRSRIPSDADLDDLGYRVDRSELKGCFLEALARLHPERLRELADIANRRHRREQAAIAGWRTRRGGPSPRRPKRLRRGPFQWCDYDSWAAGLHLTAVDPAQDWLRVFAWGLRGTHGMSLERSARAWGQAVTRDVDRARTASRPVRHRRHRVTRLAVEAFVRWQVSRQTWPDVMKAVAQVPEARSPDAVRDLVSRVAHGLGFRLRPGRRGRPKDPR